MSFALWTRQTVQALIRQRLNWTVPLRTVGEYLKRWGFTPQPPLKRAYEQRPAEIKRWLDEAYPAIAARAKREKAEIQWGDETGLRSDSQYGRSYAPKGKTPVIRRSAKRVSMNMLSTVSNRSKVRFMVYSGGMNAEAADSVFEAIDRDIRAQAAYSPELNPNEYLNGDLKAGVHSKPPARDTRQMFNCRVNK